MRCRLSSITDTILSLLERLVYFFAGSTTCSTGTIFFLSFFTLSFFFIFFRKSDFKAANCNSSSSSDALDGSLKVARLAFFFFFAALSFGGGEAREEPASFLAGGAIAGVSAVSDSLLDDAEVEDSDRLRDLDLFLSLKKILLGHDSN